jgi:hypothetical protein
MLFTPHTFQGSKFTASSESTFFIRKTSLELQKEYIKHKNYSFSH